MNNLIDTTAYSYLPENPTLFPNNFQVFENKGENVIALCVAMNCTMFQLMLNVIGIANDGGGVMRIEAYENENLSLVNPAFLGGIDEAPFQSADWNVLHPSRERRMIDDVVFDALGLTQGEQDAVYEAVMALVGDRKRRAGSV